MTSLRNTMMACAMALATVVSLTVVSAAQAASAEDLNRDSAQALRHLTETNRTANDVARNARAVLVFPNIVKAGLVFGGSYGEGTMMKGNRVVDYYNSVSGSWGLQAGAQSYGYVVFLMNDKASTTSKRPTALKSASARRSSSSTKALRRISRLDAERRRLCVHLQSARPDGRRQHRRHENLAHRPRQDTVGVALTAFRVTVPSSPPSQRGRHPARRDPVLSSLHHCVSCLQRLNAGGLFMSNETLPAISRGTA